MWIECLNRFKIGETGNRGNGAGARENNVALFCALNVVTVCRSKALCQKPSLETENRQCLSNRIQYFAYNSFTNFGGCRGLLYNNMFT